MGIYDLKDSYAYKIVFEFLVVVSDPNCTIVPEVVSHFCYLTEDVRHLRIYSGGKIRYEVGFFRPFRRTFFTIYCYVIISFVTSAVILDSEFTLLLHAGWKYLSLFP